MNNQSLSGLLDEIRACRHCEAHLALGPRPVLSAASSARVLLAGQAPGTRVHASGIPWDDPSGDRLREWLAVEREDFYDERIFAIVPMGFCYPGKGKSGDLPPRPECRQLWHDRLMALLPNIQLVVAIGAYAQDYHLAGRRQKTLTETVRRWREYDSVMPIPHPSPRNIRWFKNNPWFEAEMLPVLRERVRRALG